jgi:hypothetical protein
MKRVLLTLSITILALTARGDSIVFSSFTPPDTGTTYNSGFAWVTKGQSTTGGLLETAAQFTAMSSGDLATVELGLTYVTQGPVNAFLYADASGSPGTNLGLLGTGTPTDAFQSTDHNIVSFAVGGLVPVTMGTNYWLILKPDTTSTNDTWNLSLPAVTGKVDQSIDDSTWVVASDMMPAFRVTAIAVPEPSMLSLIGVGLVSLLMFRKGFAKR